MAGLIPYAATSVTTLLLSYDINHAAANGEGIFMSEQTAQVVLNILEPLQIGYGAVVSSRPSSQPIFGLRIFIEADHFFPRGHPLGP